MKNTLDIISVELCKTIRSIFPHQSLLFNMSASTLKTLVVRSKDILTSYMTMLSRLTKTDFLLREKDPWKYSLGYQHETIDKLMSRIDIVYSIWATYDEVLSLLSSQNKKDFERLNLLQVRMVLCFLLFFCIHFKYLSGSLLQLTYLPFFCFNS